LLDGGFFNGELSVFSLSGIVFLGIGDSASALLGKMFGATKWTKYSQKSQQGTVYGWGVTMLVYYILTGIVHKRLQEHFLIIALATLAAHLLEGLTL
jgi:dolichol kinase